jgi:hypothetical protein
LAGASAREAAWGEGAPIDGGKRPFTPIGGTGGEGGRPGEGGRRGRGREAGARAGIWGTVR